MQQLRARLTYSNIVATVALFIALGGVGYASSKINGKQIKRNSLPGDRIKRGSITLDELSPSTRLALKGNKGPAGTPGSALAYALVASDGTVDPSNSRGISTANIGAPAAHVYCLHDLPFTAHVFNVTPSEIATQAQLISPGALGPLCPAHTAVGLSMRTPNGTETDSNFYLTIN